MAIAFEKVTVGLPWEKETMMGCQVDEGQLNKILDYVELGKQEGAKLVTGGKRIINGDLGKGSFMAPTLFADVDNSMCIAQEKIFGPVVCVIKIKDEEEVIAKANESVFGLAGAVWTCDINRALRVARGVEAGRMWVNTYNQLRAHAPFGGYKKSGIGRENHKMMLDHYSQVKNIFICMSENKAGLY